MLVRRHASAFLLPGVIVPIEAAARIPRARLQRRFALRRAGSLAGWRDRRMHVRALDRELVIIGELLQQMRRLVIRLPLPAIAFGVGDDLAGRIVLIERIDLSEFDGIARLPLPRR